MSRRIKYKKKGKLLVFLMLVGTVCGLTSCGKEKQMEPEKEKVSLTVFTPYTVSNSDAVAGGFHKALEQARNAFPDYEIESKAISTEVYKSKLYIDIGSNEVPDIFFTWTDGYLAPLVKKGMVLELNDYLPESEDLTENDRYISFMEGDSVYGLALTYWYGVLYCNMNLFEKYNLEIPEDGEQLLAVCSTFRENGVLPFACGLKDIWPAHMFANQLLLQLCGAENYRAYAGGEKKCTYRDMLAIGGYLEALVDSGAFDQETGWMNTDDACREFAEGNAAMFFSGSIHTGTLEESEYADDIRIVRFPLHKDAKYPNDYLGAVSNGLSISANTKYPEEALEVAKFLAVHTAANSRMLSTWTTYDGLEETLDMQIRDLMAQGEGFGNNYDVLLSGEKKDDFLNSVLALFQKKTDKEGFARAVVGLLNQGW